MSQELTLRPRFRFHHPLPVEELVKRLKARGDLPTESIRVIKSAGLITLRVAETRRHFWSPQMEVHLEREHGAHKTLVRCMIGPMPTVWTLFMFFYGFFGFMGFVGLTLGMSQWTLGDPMWGFWLLPVSLLGMAAMYFISYEGKKLSHDEMYEMKHFVDAALDCNCLELAGMYEE